MEIRHRLGAIVLTAAMVAGMAMPLAAGATNISEKDYRNYSVEQLEQLITKLQGILAEMKKDKMCFVSDSDLTLGDGEGDDLGDDVQRLQDFLREKGFYNYKSTGYFGKITKAALISFQNSVSVSATGNFDAATRAKAHALTCKSVVRKTAEKKKEEKKEEKKPMQIPTPKTSSATSITATAKTGGVSWSVTGIAKYGVKVLWSKTSGPTYPPNSSTHAMFVGNEHEGSVNLDAFAGAGTYFVRVCEYLDGTCGTYSNEVSVSL
jgi:peptidoglycan hydrolase-like protein with peptidoglycan-binding domain